MYARLYVLTFDSDCGIIHTCTSSDVPHFRVWDTTTSIRFDIYLTAIVVLYYTHMHKF